MKFEHAVVLGGLGSHGRSIVGWLNGRAREVSVVDKDTSKDPLLTADLVFVALPVEALSQCRDLFEMIPSGAFCVFATGVMGDRFIRTGNPWDESLVEELVKRGVEVAFVHCLFGGGVSLWKQNVAVNFDHCSPESASRIRDLLLNRDDGPVNIVETQKDEHDDMMGFVQGSIRQFAIRHAYRAVKDGKTIKDLLDHSTPPYRLFLAMTVRILMQKKELCRQIVCTVGQVPFASLSGTVGSQTIEGNFDEEFDTAVKLLDPRFENLWGRLAALVPELDQRMLSSLD